MTESKLVVQMLSSVCPKVPSRKSDRTTEMRHATPEIRASLSTEFNLQPVLWIRHDVSIFQIKNQQDKIRPITRRTALTLIHSLHAHPYSTKTQKHSLWTLFICLPFLLHRSNDLSELGPIESENWSFPCYALKQSVVKLLVTAVLKTADDDIIRPKQQTEEIGHDKNVHAKDLGFDKWKTRMYLPHPMAYSQKLVLPWAAEISKGRELRRKIDGHTKEFVQHTEINYKYIYIYIYSSWTYLISHLIKFIRMIPIMSYCITKTVSGVVKRLAQYAASSMWTFSRNSWSPEFSSGQCDKRESHMIS